MSPWLWIGILLIAPSATFGAEGKAGPAPCPVGLNLGADEVAARIMTRNAERAQKLRGFESTREYTLDHTGFPSSLSAEMEVKAAYSAAGTKNLTVVSESGSKLLRNRVFHRLLESEKESASDEANRSAVALTTANYHFSLLGCTSADSRLLFVMQLEPLSTYKYLYRGTVWIDAHDFAVWRIEAEPAQNPSLWIRRTEIHHQYQKIGDFYLPAVNQTFTDMRLGGKAVLTIRYRDYKLPLE
jgi:hypothetical protein